ncbi:MAG: DMT family transporter [bacterium]
MFNISQKEKGILALVAYAFLGAVMGIWVRIMSSELTLYQQIAARAFVGGILGLIFYRKYLHLKSFTKISRRDLILFIIRGILIISAVGLYTASILRTKFANVSFIGTFPTTAILGIIILKEKLTKQKLALLVLSLIGASLLSISDFHHLLNWGLGETLALISTVFYSLSYITRKFISKHLNNEEITVGGTIVSFMMAILVSLFLKNSPTNFLINNINVLFVIFLAGITYLLVGYCISVGFEHVEAIVANNILTLGAVFGLMIGLLVYHEVPTLQEVIGGLFIVISALLMDRISKRE